MLYIKKYHYDVLNLYVASNLRFSFEIQSLSSKHYGEYINYKTLNGYYNKVFKNKLKISRKSHYK